MAPAGENGGGLERGDLIRPTGAVLKFIHSDDPADKTGPKFEASFEVGDENRAEGSGDWMGATLTERGRGGLFCSPVLARACVVACIRPSRLQGDEDGGDERVALCNFVGHVTRATLPHVGRRLPTSPVLLSILRQMDDVKMDFRAEQYEQALSLKDSAAALANWQTFFPFRPKTSPLQDPKAWWR